MSVPKRNERGKFEKYYVSVPERNERGEFEKYSKCPFLKEMKEANLKNTLKCPFLKEMKEANLKNTRSPNFSRVSSKMC